MKEEKLFFQKVLIKLAIPTVIYGAYHEIASLDDEDYDARIAISVKAGLTIALMLFATGIGEVLVIGIAIELIWMKLSGYFIDSKMEVMIEKSLFYQEGRKPYILESLSSDTNPYLLKGVEKPIKDITLSRKAKEVRDFIYINFQAHKKELQAAFAYEMSSIYATLKDVDIRTSLKTNDYTSNNAPYHICSYVSINKEFYREIKRMVLLEDDKEIEITAHEQHKDKEFIDLMGHVVVKDTGVIMEYPKKETKLLIHSDTISLKYDVVYSYDASSKVKDGAQGGALTISSLQPVPLTKDDCKILNIEES